MRPAARPAHHLAEINVARLKAPLDDPRTAGFTDNLGRLNALAERMPGFVWRYTDASGNATDTRVDPDPLVIPNLSLWSDARALETYVFGTLHRQFYARRAEWMGALGSMHFAMWWVPEGHRPDMAEALARLAHLDVHGDTDHAFGWAHLRDLSTWRTARCAPATSEPA
ncbi:MAG: DUF3291 domain-containing protein [Shimia sp.]